MGTARPHIKHVAMTIHGVNTRLRLDEGESMLAQLAGLVDTLQAWDAPSKLEKITIVEIQEARVERIKHALRDFLEEVHYARPAEDSDTWAYDLTFERQQTVETPDAGEAQVKPYILAIFPERSDLEDIFYYGIERPVHAMGLLCERLNPDDEVTDENDIQAALNRIALATAVICDVSTITPMLYLQLGFAWGKGIPTALITQDESTQFGTDNHVQYEKIWQLEERLGQWLKTKLWR